jgi:hypothetical protein
MFGLDIVAIIAGAIGGGVGGLVGSLLGFPFKSPQVRRVLAVAFVTAGIGISQPIIKPLVDGQIGTSIRANQFDTTYENEVLPAVKKVPALERIFRDHPETAANFRAKARQSYEKGGAQQLLNDAPSIGAEVLAAAFISYMPRARTQDLILFAATMGDVLSAFNDKDPEACVLYQFGATYGRPLGHDRLLAAIGEDRQKKQLDVMNVLVVNAGDKPVTFDETKATLAVASLAQRHADLLTGKSNEVAQGKRPPADTAEAKAACGFAAALFNDIATTDAATAELILRKMFSTP